ncbi:MAG: response regulator transcription factor [Oscillospiraceae bacterium]|nr:response regulator transcription factor [Oscillospiraceae bacterium]
MEIKNKILVIEDERRISNFLCTVLRANNYDVICLDTGSDACSVINSHCPDLIILDLGLPDMDGTDILRSVREWSSMPILVVSARSDERDKVSALEMGADDYITKPFGTQELLARIRTALRHTLTTARDSGISVEGVFRTGGLTIDYNKYRVYVDGRDANLTQNEFKIVALLGKNAGKVLTYDYIIRQLWGPHAKTDNQILRVNMANIRRKIENKPAEPQYIFTEVGVGYRMAESDNGVPVH